MSGSGDQAVKETLSEALEGAEPGEQASGQTAGQADHPHSSSSLGGAEHVDGWIGTKQEDGSVTFEKEHTETSS
jgi:hypothetical protein